VRRWLEAVLAAALAVAGTGCFRFTDPYYLILKPLEAGEPPLQGYSLLYGTVELPPGLFPAQVDAVVLRQLHPENRWRYFQVSEVGIFRAFQRRALREGTFAFHLPIGVYELERLESWSLGRATVWPLNEASRIQSRVYITRPGVYDLGTLRLTAPEGLSRPYYIQALGDAWSARRYDALRALVRGTPWARDVP
jgi:hypothetical protein